MTFSSRDFSLQYISSSYQDVVQRYSPVGTSSYFLDGLGNVIASLPLSSIGGQIVTLDQSITASIALYADFAGTASISVDSMFSETASIALYSDFAGTSSLAFSASWVSESTFIITAQTASYITSSNIDGVVGSSSYAYTSSCLTGFVYNTDFILTSLTMSDIVVLESTTESLRAAFFDYTVYSGSDNIRVGTIFGGWDNNGNVSYTEVSNVDMGDTSQVSMSMGISSGYVQLLTNVSDTIDWTIKAMGRYL